LCMAFPEEINKLLKQGFWRTTVFFRQNEPVRWIYEFFYPELWKFIHNLLPAAKCKKFLFQLISLINFAFS
jgi:hypothetical protein